jgi:hypothetical protein
MVSNAEIVIVLVVLLLVIWYLGWYEGEILVLWDDEILKYTDQLIEFENEMQNQSMLHGLPITLEHIKSIGTYFVYCILMDHDSKIRGTCCMIMKDLPDLKLSNAWYICDLKVAPDYRGREYPARMIKKALIQGTAGLYGTKMFSLAFDDTAIGIFKNYGFNEGPKVNISTDRKILIEPTEPMEPEETTSATIMENGLEDLKDWKFLEKI